MKYILVPLHTLINFLHIIFATFIHTLILTFSFNSTQYPEWNNSDMSFTEYINAQNDKFIGQFENNKISQVTKYRATSDPPTNGRLSHPTPNSLNDQTEDKTFLPQEKIPKDSTQVKVTDWNFEYTRISDGRFRASKIFGLTWQAVCERRTPVSWNRQGARSKILNTSSHQRASSYGNRSSQR